MSFHIECSKCHVKSPPTESSFAVPGWSAVSVPKGKSTETSFRCATCTVAEQMAIVEEVLAEVIAEEKGSCAHGNDPIWCEVCHPELESDEDYEKRTKAMDTFDMNQTFAREDK